MKKIKIFALIFTAVLALSLCSCAFLDSFIGGGGKAVLPDVSGPKTELTREEAVAIYDKVMSYGAGGDGVPNYQSVIDKVIDSKAFSTPATAEEYLKYIAECERSYFENGGSVNLGDGYSVTVLFTSKESEIVLVVHRLGTMTVVYIELDLPEPEPIVWPTDEEFARYSAKLSQAAGTKLGHVNHTLKEYETFADCDQIQVVMENATRKHYLDYLSIVKAQGFVLEPHGDSWDGQEIYIAYKTVGKTAYGCEVRYVDDGRVSVVFWNETQNLQRDSGILISDLWEKGTFVVRSEYLFTPEEGYYPDEVVKPDGGIDKGDVSYEPYMRYEYMTISFSERGYLEFWNNDKENKAVEISKEYVFRNFGSEIYDYENKIIYRLYNGGMNKLSEKDEFKHNPGAQPYDPNESLARFYYSVERHASARGTIIGSHYHTARNLVPTGRKNVIAGIECVEYTGTCFAVDGDNIITWEATFNVWEKYNIALSYKGQRWWDDETEYYEEYVYISEDSWLDYALDLPDYGTYFDWFPSDEMIAETGITVPAIEGSCGFYIDYATRPDEEVGILGPKEYYRYVFGEVTRSEYLAYRKTLEKAGFAVPDEWTSPYKYRESDNAKIEMQMMHDEEKKTLTIYFSIIPMDPVYLPPVGTYSIRYVDHNEERFVDYIFYANGNISVNGHIYTKTGKYTYFYDGREINVVDLYLSFEGCTSVYFVQYTGKWGYNYVGTDTVNGIPVSIYQGENSNFKVWIDTQSGFILKRVYEGNVTIELIDYSANT